MKLAPPAVPPSSPATPGGSSGRLWIVLAAILLAAAGLRLWRLDSVPPGAWIDEAIQGLQGTAWLDGEKLPATAHVGYQPMPEWIAPEVVAIRLGGEGLGTIRTPAALAGLAAVVFGFLAGRAVAGAAGGLGAAAFLAASFWHLQYCRLALPCVFVVTEGLLAAWLLLGRAAPGAGAAVALAALCVVAPYGYAASLITPVVVALLLAARWWGSPDTRPRPAVTAILAVGAILLVAGIAWWRPQGLLRTTELAGENHEPLIRQVIEWARSLGLSSAPSYYYWHSYPPGSPRFGPIEVALVLGGAVALWISDGLARWQKWGWTAWAALSAVPELLSGEVPHLSRGLPQLAPAAVAAGAGVAWLVKRGGRIGPGLAAVILLADGGLTVHKLARFAADPLVSRWYMAPDREAAEWVLDQAAKEPVALSPAYDYRTAPTMLYYLHGAVRRGAVVFADRWPRRDMFPKTIVHVRSSGQPVFVAFEASEKWNGRRWLVLYSVDELLQNPEKLLSAGRLQDALREYRKLFAIVPDAMGVRGGLGITLLRLGRPAEARPHLEYALSCGPEGAARGLVERALAMCGSAVPAPRGGMP